jgi:hypothetical protein
MESIIPKLFIFAIICSLFFAFGCVGSDDANAEGQAQLNEGASTPNQNPSSSDSTKTTSGGSDGDIGNELAKAFMLKNQKCSFSSSDPEGNFDFVIYYMDEDNFKTITTITEDSDVYTSYIIARGDTMYQYSDSSSQGYIYHLDSDEFADVDSFDPSEVSYDLDSDAGTIQGYSYSCESYTVTEAELTPDPNIDFIDMSEFMGDSMADACEQCLQYSIDPSDCDEIC